ncbi:MAG: hypothetical protein WCX77_04135 [Candidatus Paceibacterota bacterium]|jgi:hypothetical protein
MENNITFSTDAEVDKPAKGHYRPVEYKDWDRIKRKMLKLTSGSDWINKGWSATIGWFALSSAVTLLIVYSQDKTKKYYLYLFIFCLIFSAVFFIFARIIYKQNKNLINEILEEMNEVESKCQTSNSNKPLEILYANYGIDGLEKDIAKILDSKVINNTLEIKIDNNLDGDPAPGHKKRLVVKYLVFGAEKQKEILENEMLILP